MGKFIFSPIFWVLPLWLWSQQNSIRVLPEFGLAMPHGAFSAQNVFAGIGAQMGIHVDKKLKFFGLGLYVGFDGNKVKTDYPIPANNTNLAIETSQQIGLDRWQQWKAGMGPWLSFELVKKFNIHLGSKIGLSKISYPVIEQQFQLIQPLSSPVYTLYQTLHSNPEAKLNPMLFSFLRLEYSVSKGLGIFASGNYTHVRNVKHAYRYLDGNFSPTMSNEAFLQALRTSPMVMEVRKCHFNTVGFTVGIGVNLGGDKKDKPEKKQQDSKKPTSLSPQYHHLLSSNGGNYVEVSGQLRVGIPWNVTIGERVSCRIFNSSNQEIYTTQNLTPGSSGKNYTVDELSRLTIDLSGFRPGNYVFELRNEQGRTYYFRFKIASNVVPGKK